MEILPRRKEYRRTSIIVACVKRFVRKNGDLYRSRRLKLSPKGAPFFGAPFT